MKISILVNCHFVTGADPTVNEVFLGRFLAVAVAGSDRVGLDDQLSGLVEAGVGAVGPLDTDENSGQANSSGDTGLVAPFTVGLHTDYIGLDETVVLKDGNMGEENGKLLELFVGERCGTAQDDAKTG